MPPSVSPQLGRAWLCNPQTTYSQAVRISHVAQARGRPRKDTTEDGDADHANHAKNELAPKPTRRGRPKKTTTGSQAEGPNDPSSSQQAGGVLPPSGKVTKGHKKSTTASKAADKAAQSAADVSPSAAEVSPPAADEASHQPGSLQSDVNADQPDYPPVKADNDAPRRVFDKRQLVQQLLEGAMAPEGPLSEAEVAELQAIEDVLVKKNLITAGIIECFNEE
eukprot:jgi/Chrzof1/3609/Cz13g02070.t1